MKRISLPPFSFNPIVRRELRARWRGWRGYYPLLIAAVVLALGMTGLYALNVGDNSGISSSTGLITAYNTYGATYTRPLYGDTPITNEAELARAELAREGRSIFLYLMMGQGVLCLLLSPALTASSVAIEREGGMLEALQLSPLNGWGIARGKLLAALSLGALLLLLPLPAVAVCFFLGGVSPTDFLLALALQSSIFCCGSCAGLLFGSRNRGALSAYLDAYFYVGFYCFVTGSLAGVLSLTTPFARTVFTRTTATFLIRPTGEFTLADLLCGLNPLTALYSATGQDTIAGALPCALAWPVGLASQFVIGLLCFVLAARRVAQPLPDRNAEPSRARKRRKARSGPVTVTIAAPVAPDDALTISSPDATQDAPQTSPRLWHELPLEGWLNFANPVLQREARARFRLQLPWNLARRSTWRPLLLVAVAAYGGFVWWLLSHTDADALCTLLIYVALCIALILPAVLAATAFSREREKDTWLALHLSLLSTPHIVRGKLLATLLVCALYMLPIWPPLLIAGWQSIGPGVLWVPLLMAGSTLFSATCGLWFSWRCRRTVTAVCSTLVLLLLWRFATLPLLSMSAGLLIENVHSQGYSDYSSSQFYDVEATESRIVGAIHRYEVASYLNALHIPAALSALNNARQNRSAAGQFFDARIISYRQLNVAAACAASLIFTALLSALALLALERAVRRTRGTEIKPAAYTLRQGLNPQKVAS